MQNTTEVAGKNDKSDYPSHPKEPGRIRSALLAIRGAREYDTAVNQLNQLVDEIGDNPRDPRYRFIETLSVLIEAYDAEHHALSERLRA